MTQARLSCHPLGWVVGLRSLGPRRRKRISMGTATSPPARPSHSHLPPHHHHPHHHLTQLHASPHHHSPHTASSPSHPHPHHHPHTRHRSHPRCPLQTHRIVRLLGA